MTVYELGDPSARDVLIQPADDHDLEGIQKEAELIRESVKRPFRLIALRTEDWNRDLSPWEAPPVFGKEGFGGGAAATLEEVRKLCADPDRRYYIGGYSLAGLFALWVACRTDRFAGAAAASPSVWFPGFTDYLKTNRIRCGRVYLSLGDREEKTRNPVMATVADRIRETQALLTAQGADCVLEWNPGNHFRDPEIRTARAFAWILGGGDAEKLSGTGKQEAENCHGE